MVAKGKGILAADESSGTIKKRFDAIGVENTEDNRRDYREFMFRTPAMKDYISGVILFDETIRQKAKDGTPLVDIIEASGAVPGIKVDAGAKPLAGSAGRDRHRRPRRPARALRRISQARRALRQMARDLRSDAAVTENCINANAHALARYAALAQENGIVPIVEPEVLMDYDNDIDTCAEVTEWVLKETFQELYYAGVVLEGIDPEAQHDRSPARNAQSRRASRKSPTTRCRS